MKGKIIGKILVILLAIVMVLPLSAFVVSAEESPAVDTTIRDRIDHIIVNQGRTPTEQADYDSMKWQMQLESDISYIRNYVDEQEKLAAENKSAKASKESLEKVQNSLKVVKDNLPGFISVMKDASNGGDFDTAQMLNSVFTLASDIASCCGPYGQIAAVAIDLFDTIFTAIMGGEAATSDLAQMEDRLNQQLDDIQNQLSDIEEQINGLSDEINESTNKIISEVTTAIDNADAKQYLRTFMLSGEGNFSYNEYRNYIYGTIEGNSKANTAYYSWLKYYTQEVNSEDLVKNYYDLLYKSLMDGWNEYYDYIIGADTGKSIVQYYYDVVSANPNLLKDTDMSPELAAIMFAYDIYQTELMVDQLISTCNFYQYTYFLLYGASGDGKDYVYDKYNSEGFVTREQLEWSISEQISVRINEIESQLAYDVAYILNLDDSYVVESIDGNIYEIVNSNPDTYGNVLVGQTIYLNSVPQEICELFEFEKSDFNYTVSVPTRTEGVFLVDSNANNIQASLCYKGQEVNTISFRAGTHAKFNGGNGTASDPYLIASAVQFASISDGLDKHYRLICDIDFNGATITPVGQKVNGNDAIVYDEFVGSLDGNGYTISNLNVVGHTNAGLFGIIGETGEVADLKLYNVKVSANITNAEKSTSEFYAGMIAGKNNGIIKYCSIDSDGTTAKITVPNYDLTPEQLFTGPWTIEVDAPIYGLFLDVNNSTKNRNIYAYVGGIAGGNNYAVVGCTVANVHISGSSTHNFGGDSTSTNKNNVYVGGICGSNNYAIAYSVVENSTKITSYAKSIYNPQTTVNPYVVAYAGGIVARTSSLSGVYQVESSADIIQNDTKLDCKSNWGEHYKNCSDEKDTYVPKYSEDELKAIVATEDVEEFIAKTERDYTVTFECPNTVYEAGSDTFNTENLKFFINGVEKEYEIVDIYGFDAQNEEFDSVSQNIVVLFSVEIEGETVYFAQDITVTIEENVVTSIEILNLKDSYVKDTFSLEGLVIKYNYAVGNPEYVTINSENISQIRYFGNITTFGTQSIALLCNGDTVEFEINVVCGHGNNFTSSASGYAYDESLSKAPTCAEIGHNAYVCGTCGDIQYFYLRKTEHIPDYENAVGAMDATCTEEGNTGKICCVDCGETLIEGKVIPKLNHHYVYVDGDKHACSNGSHSEYHHYTVTESVQLLDPDKNGAKEWYIVYTYTCICQKENDEQYSKIEIDENSVTNETKELPTIAISNGYVTSGGKEVVVYVQLTNNYGLKSAVFGIRYDRGLELVGDPQIGNLFKNLTINEKEQIYYGYNFVFANAALVSGNGNLVKLTFKVTDDAKIGDIFNISVVYNEMGKSVDGTPIMGGFSDGEQINVVTRNGYVKVVGEGQLPGDVNNDNIVDLMDAVLLAKFYANSEKYPLTTEDADIDLDREITPDDIVALLEYLIGGYGTNLLTQDFEIVLNTNGYGDIVLNDLLVSIYGDNNTYDAAGLNAIISKIENRTGYKFLGWYDQMVGGNLIFGGDQTEDVFVVYNKNQKKQTLYAHWELNSFSFDIGDATNGEGGKVYYTDGVTVIPQNPEKHFDVSFVSDLKSHYADTTGKLIYEFAYWEDVCTGKQYYKESDIIRALQSEHWGAVELVAVFNESPNITYPIWKVDGYEPTVSWYANLSVDQSLIDNNTDIRDCSTININGKPHYLVYANHTPIEYYLKFESNGGTMMGIVDDVVVSGNGHSIANPYKFANNANVSKIGGTFCGWIDNYGNAYDPYADIGYINGAAQGATVTLTAQWDKILYTLSFSENGGVMPGDKKITYFVESVDGIILPIPTYPTYSNYNKFAGWYEDKELTQKFDKATLKANPKNTTLYAKWDLCMVYNINNTPQKITGNRVIVDWSSASSGTYNSNRTIYTENVSQIYFVGNPNTVYNNLIISAFAGTTTQANQMIHFKNFNMNGYLTKTDNSVNLNMTIDCLGNNAIKAPTETSAIVKFTSLTFTGSGNLSIHGGNGVNATTAGGNGSNGVIAIIVDNITVDMTGALNVAGGAGGNGYKGTDGTQGSTGANGLNQVRGSTGDPGINGNNGGNGASGATSIKAKSITILSGNIILQGGTGGAGGKGGVGGQGGTGGVGYAGVIGSAGAGNGGSGGSGGFGGNGGNGGLAVQCKVVNITDGNLTLQNGDAGAGGAGGAGGKGGTGGNSTQWGFYCGLSGGGGSGGLGGNGGNGGSVNKIETAVTINRSTDASVIINEGTVGSGGTGGYGGAVGTPGKAALNRPHFDNGTDNSNKQAANGSNGKIIS